MYSYPLHYNAQISKYLSVCVNTSVDAQQMCKTEVLRHLFVCMCACDCVL